MLAIEILLKGTVLLGVAYGLAAALRGAAAATRHLVWAFGLLALLALSVLTVAAPWRLAVVPALAPGATAVFGVAEAPPVTEATRIDASEAPVGPVAAATETSGEAPALSTPTAEGATASPAAAETGARLPVALLIGIWAAGALAVFSRWIVGLVSLRRVVRRARPLEGPEWDAALREATDRLLLDTPVRLLAGDVPMPLTAGALRPVVILPEAAMEWTDERRRAVILHELAHVRRRDALTHALGWAATGLWWFHPMVWSAARHLRAESERACDDLVLRAGTRASSYADHLLDIVCHATSPRAPLPAMPLAQRSEFEGRMLRILSPDARRHGLSALKGVALALAFASVAVPLAAIGMAPPALADVGDNAPAEDRSTARRVVDAFLPDVASRVVAERFLDPAPEASTAEREQDRADHEADLNTDTDTDSDTDDAVDVDSEDVSEPAMSPQERTRAVTALMARLSDTDAEVRQAAARALAGLADPRALEALMRALRTDPDAGVRQMAAWALGEIEDAKAVPALGEALRGDADAEVRAVAAWALGQIESPRAIEYLQSALRDSSPAVRMKTVWALGQIEDPAAVPALTGLLRDSNAEIRQNAAWALGQIESPAAVDALVGALGDSNVEVRRKAVWALGQIEDPRALPGLAGALRDGDAEVRSHAAWAIGELQPAAAPAALIDAAGDANAEVRENVAWALGEIEDPAAVPALRRLTQDPMAEVRKDAIRALTDIHAPVAYEALVGLLEDEDPEVRREAARALGDANWEGDE